MKTWLTKLKISNSLNDRKPLPPSMEQTIANSDELRRFAENSRALDGALKLKPVEPPVSDSLHDSIMRAVRATNREQVSDSQRAWPRWILVPALAGAMVFGIILARNRVDKSPIATSQALALAGSVLERGSSLVEEAPATAISPLSDEMQGLNRDLTNTAHFLAASLP